MGSMTDTDVALKVMPSTQEAMRCVKRYAPLIGKMVAKNNGSTFSNGRSFATVSGILWVPGEVHPVYLFSDVCERVECFRCREAR